MCIYFQIYFQNLSLWDCEGKRLNNGDLEAAQKKKTKNTIPSSFSGRLFSCNWSQKSLKKRISERFGVPRNFTPQDRSISSKDISQLPVTDRLVPEQICRLADLLY